MGREQQAPRRSVRRPLASWGAWVAGAGLAGLGLLVARDAERSGDDGGLALGVGLVVTSLVLGGWDVLKRLLRRPPPAPSVDATSRTLTIARDPGHGRPRLALHLPPGVFMLIATVESAMMRDPWGLTAGGAVVTLYLLGLPAAAALGRWRAGGVEISEEGVRQVDHGAESFVRWLQVERVEWRDGTRWWEKRRGPYRPYPPERGRVWLTTVEGSPPTNRRLTPLWRRGDLSRRRVVIKEEGLALDATALAVVLEVLWANPDQRDLLGSAAILPRLDDPAAWRDALPLPDFLP